MRYVLKLHLFINLFIYFLSVQNLVSVTGAQTIETTYEVCVRVAFSYMFYNLSFCTVSSPHQSGFWN